MCSVVVEVMGHLMHIKWHIATKSSYWRHNCKFYANFVVFSDFWAGWSIFGACNTSAFLIKFISHSMFSWFFHIVKNVKSQRKTRETFWHFACIHYTCFWLVFNGSLLSLWFWFFEICISELLWRFSVTVSCEQCSSEERKRDLYHIGSDLTIRCDWTSVTNCNIIDIFVSLFIWFSWTPKKWWTGMLTISIW